MLSVAAASGNRMLDEFRNTLEKNEEYYFFFFLLHHHIIIIIININIIINRTRCDLLGRCQYARTRGLLVDTDLIHPI
jgi:hypothetical protein